MVSALRESGSTIPVLIITAKDGFDSLALMMMSMEIEDAFDFKFTEFVKFETVGDVCRYLEGKI